MGGGSEGVRMRTRFRAALAVVVLASIPLSFLAAIPRIASAFNVTSVTIDAPAGGEVWSGGSVHTLRYWITSDSGNPGIQRAWISYSSDTATGPVADPAPGTVGSENVFDWTLPSADLTNVTITVCGTDSGPTLCSTSAAFAIDGTAPTLTSYTPSGGNAGLLDPIEFHFSEAIDIAKAQAA